MLFLTNLSCLKERLGVWRFFNSYQLFLHRWPETKGRAAVGQSSILSKVSCFCLFCICIAFWIFRIYLSISWKSTARILSVIWFLGLAIPKSNQGWGKGRGMDPKKLLHSISLLLTWGTHIDVPNILIPPVCLVLFYEFWRNTINPTEWNLKPFF